MFDFCLNVVFNNVSICVRGKQMNAEQVISKLGGSAEVARLMGYPKHIGTQRVNNWKKRGIPARVMLERPDLFRRVAG